MVHLSLLINFKNMISELKKLFGQKCTGIKINGDFKEFFINVPVKKMKFCEAVACSFGLPLQLNNKNTECPAARRSIGFDKDDRQLAEIISDRNDIPNQFVDETLKDIPKQTEIKNISLGITDYMEERIQPDLYIIYLQPANVTAVIHALAKHGINVSISPYSLLSVCGNVFSKTLQNEEVTVSFGCPESRKAGGIHHDEVVMGIPQKITGILLNSLNPQDIYQ